MTRNMRRNWTNCQRPQTRPQPCLPMAVELRIRVPARRPVGPVAGLRRRQRPAADGRHLKLRRPDRRAGLQLVSRTGIRDGAEPVLRDHYRSDIGAEPLSGPIAAVPEAEPAIHVPSRLDPTVVRALWQQVPNQFRVASGWFQGGESQRTNASNGLHAVENPKQCGLLRSRIPRP